jgi:hypothetical protein
LASTLAAIAPSLISILPYFDPPLFVSDGLDECDGISFEHNPPNGRSFIPFWQKLDSIIQHHVHVPNNNNNNYFKFFFFFLDMRKDMQNG